MASTETKSAGALAPMQGSPKTRTFPEFVILVLPSLLMAKPQLSDPAHGAGADGINLSLFSTLYGLYRTYRRALDIYAEHSADGTASDGDMIAICDGMNRAVVAARSKGGAQMGPASQWKNAPSPAPVAVAESAGAPDVQRVFDGPASTWPAAK